MRSKFLFPLLGLASGIFVSESLITGLLFPSLALGLAFIFWLILTFISRTPAKALKYSYFHFIWITLLFCGIGAIDFYFRANTFVEKNLENDSFLFTGEITDIKYLSGGDRFTVKVLDVRERSGKLVTTKNLNLLVKTNGYVGSKGDIISFTSSPVKIKNPDYARKLKHQGISYTVNINFTEITSKGHSPSISLWLNEFRFYVISLIEKSSLERGTADFIISFLLGEKSYLPLDTREILSSAGMAHIMALSGMHVAIMLSMFLLFLFPLSLLGLNKWRRVIAIVLIWVYVLLTGAAPSTIRAAIMATFLMGSLIIERKNSAINSLLAAAVIILFINPYDLWNIGMQLSFLCVAAILIFKDKLNPIDHHSHPVLFKLTDAFLITLISTLSIWILIAFYFNTVPLLFLPTNILLLPLLPVFVTLTSIFIVCLFLGFNFSPLSDALDFFYRIFIHSADYLSLSGKSVIYIDVPSISLLFWILVVSFLAVCIYSKNKNIKILNAALASCFCFATIYSIITYQNEQNDSLKFLHSFTKMEVHYASGKNVVKLSFPRKSISNVSNSQFNIIAIDNKLYDASVNSIDKMFHPEKNFLIIGPEANLNQTAAIIASHENISKVILHPGVGKNKKTELLSLLDISFWNKIYSLRDNGSLGFDLSSSGASTKELKMLL